MKCVRMVLTEETFRRFAISNLLPLRGIEDRPGSTTKQFAATIFWGTTYLQIAIGHNSCHYKRLLFFPGGPFKDSYNLNSFMDQAGMSTTYSTEPYKTSCRGHMIKAFVWEMVTPVCSVISIV